MTSVLITGASGLLGRAIAQQFSEDYENLGLHFRHRQPDLHQINPHANVYLIQQELAETDIDAVSLAMLQEFESAAGAELDVLVLNASAQNVTAFTDLKSADWDAMYRQTLRHTASLLQAAANRFRDSGNQANKCIVVVGSIEGIKPALNHAPYAVFKAALHHLVAAAANELGTAGVRVVGVAPGLIARPGIETDWPDGVSRWQSAAALGRMVTPIEVAKVIHFLASANASAITGVTVPVDAGWSSNPGW